VATPDSAKQVKFFERARNFILKDGTFDNEKALKEYEKFGSMVDVSRSKFQADAQLQFRDIPMMLQDPIIAACLASMMETAFQPTHDQQLITVNSRYPKLADVLNTWHKETGMDDFALLVANNVGLYGNLPIKMYYNKQMQLDRFVPIADFLSVVPIIVSNRVIGYYVDGEYCDFHEYVYAQYLHYRDLGGTRNPMFKLSQRPGDNENPVDMQNEFVLAPSYLSPAVRPWRNIRLIEDVLILQRMDQSNFLRIVGVNVGDNITSKNAMRLLNFYRAIFKKARRVPFDQYGMASSGFGNEFEVVIPTSAKQSLDIKDLGGQVDVKSLVDLDLQYQRLFTSLRTSPSIVGFTEDTPSSLGEGPTTVWNNNHARTAKVFQFSTLKAIKQIDLLYLRSRGYDVSLEDWQITVSAASTSEEESKRKSITAGLEVFDKAITSLNGTGIEYNKEYLVKELLQQAFATSPLDMSQLFDVEDKKNIPTPEPQAVTGALLIKDRISRTSILASHNIISTEVFDEYKRSLAPITSDQVSDTPTDGTQLILSDNSFLTQRVMSYGEYLSSGFLAAANSSKVDLTTIDGTLVISNFDTRTFKRLAPGLPLTQGRPLAMGLYAVGVTPEQKILEAKLLLDGSITTIKSVYIQEGRYVFDNNEDLINYLYIASSGVREFAADRVYIKNDDQARLK